MFFSISQLCTIGMPKYMASNRYDFMGRNRWCAIKKLFSRIKSGKRTRGTIFPLISGNSKLRAMLALKKSLLAVTSPLCTQNRIGSF